MGRRAVGRGGGRSHRALIPGCGAGSTGSRPVPLRRRVRSRRRQQREPAVAASGGEEIKTQWLALLLSRTGKRGSDQTGERADAPGQVSRWRPEAAPPARRLGSSGPPGPEPEAPGPVRGSRRLGLGYARGTGGPSDPDSKPDQLSAPGDLRRLAQEPWRQGRQQALSERPRGVRGAGLSRRIGSGIR